MIYSMTYSLSGTFAVPLKIFILTKIACMCFVWFLPYRSFS